MISYICASARIWIEFLIPLYFRQAILIQYSVRTNCSYYVHCNIVRGPANSLSPAENCGEIWNYCLIIIILSLSEINSNFEFDSLYLFNHYNLHFVFRYFL